MCVWLAELAVPSHLRTRNISALSTPGRLEEQMSLHWDLYCEEA